VSCCQALESFCMMIMSPLFTVAMLISSAWARPVKRPVPTADDNRMRVKCFMSAPPLRMLAHKNTCVKNLSVKGGANVKQACAISTSLGTKCAVLQSIRMIILMDNDAGPLLQPRPLHRLQYFTRVKYVDIGSARSLSRT